MDLNNTRTFSVYAVEMDPNKSLPDNSAEVTAVNGTLQSYIKMVYESSDVMAKYKAVHSLRKYLAAKIENDDCNYLVDKFTPSTDYLSQIEDALASNVHGIIVSIIKEHIHAQFRLESDQVKLLHESYWILTNLSAGNSSQTCRIESTGIVPDTIRLINSSTEYYLVTQCFMILNNFLFDNVALNKVGNCDKLFDKSLEILVNEAKRICHKCPEEKCEKIKKNEEKCPVCKDYAMNEENQVVMIDFFIALNNSELDWQYTEEQREKVTLISCRLLTQQDSEIVEQKLLELLFGMFKSGRSYLIDTVLKSGLVPNLLTSIFHTNLKIRKLLIQFIGSLILGTDEQTLHILRCYFVVCFPMILHDDMKEIGQQMAWLLSNVTASRPDMIQIMFEFDLFPYIVHFIEQTDDNKIALEALWVVQNFVACGDKEQVKMLLMFDRYRCISVIVDRLLQSESRGVKLELEEMERIAEILLEITNCLKQHFWEYHDPSESTVRPTLSKTDPYHTVITLLKTLHNETAFEVMLIDDEVPLKFRTLLEHTAHFELITLES